MKNGDTERELTIGSVDQCDQSDQCNVQSHNRVKLITRTVHNPIEAHSTGTLFLEYVAPDVKTGYQKRLTT